MIIEHKTGDATSPKPDPATANLPVRGVIIAHINNSIGAWGAGFVLAVDKLSPIPKFAYQQLAKFYNKNIPLGTTNFYEIMPELHVANMVAQNGISKKESSCLVDYKALRECLITVFKRAARLGCNVHIPAGIGSGLAGGDRAKIHAIMDDLTTCPPMLGLEKAQGFVPKLTLWEFTDTAADSYIGPSNDTKGSNPVVATVNKALDDFKGKRHIDLGEDDL